MQQTEHFDLGPSDAADYAAFVLDAFGAADYELDLHSGRIRPSPRLNALYGYPPDHPLTPADCRARYHPDDAAAVDSIIPETLARGERSFQREFRIVLPDGTVRLVLSRGEVLRDGDGRPAVVRGAALDITERARAETAVRASEESYRTLLDSIEQGFCLFEMLYDPGGAPVDYRFLKVNRTFERHTGLRDPVGRTARELVPSLEPHWFEIYGQVAATGETLRFEQRSSAMGRWFEVEAVRVGSAERHQVALIFTDVTARRQGEADARFLSEVGELIRVSEDADRLLDAVAGALGRHLQVERCFFSEIDSRGDRWAIRHADRPIGTSAPVTALSAFAPAVLATLRSGRGFRCDDAARDERTAVAYESAYQPLGLGAFLAVPLMTEGTWVGSLVAGVAAPRAWMEHEVSLIETVAERTWNVVERLRLYAQERAARTRAEEASRLKDEFLATVSHELRTPLTAFLGYAELLRRRAHDGAYVTRTVEKMVQSAKVQAALIEDLLDVSRIVSGKIRVEAAPVALRDVVSAAIDTVRPAVDAKGLRMLVDLDPDAGAVLGDPNRLQQVVWNLLLNATKFTPPGGSITVRLARAGRDVEVTVADSGQGIPADFLPYVFDRFRQADSSSHRAHGGLGLGLAIVRHLVELHGGTVAVASDGPDRGATFTVRLPTATGGARGAGLGPAAGALPLRGVRLLVVDDQPDLLELLTQILAAHGAVVQVCSSARAALDAVRAWRPDVLVSDIAMPGEDGYWLIEQVRRLGAEDGGAVPAVALTAYVRVEDRLRVLAAGFQQYVPKPVDADELRDVILRLAPGPR